MTNNNYATYFTGTNEEVPSLSGKTLRYINLDNAASTPPLIAVQKAINNFIKYYSSVHRGTGFKSQLSTFMYEDARRRTMDFVGADPRFHTCIFGKNTTEAINKLAHRFPFTQERNVVLTSGMEHHSNDLPWRSAAQLIHVQLSQDGQLDEEDFNYQIERFGERIALVAITGASNVTGYLNPIHRLAKKAHMVGAQILVDCAQLAPHRKINMLAVDDPGHLNYVVISAHKLYAPFGTGALIGPRATFEHGDPDQTGGGTVKIVTLEDVVWDDPPEREEAGSPNTIGAVALAAAIHQLEQIGMDVVAAHEAELTAYALERLKQLPDIKIYGDPDPRRAGDRLGVIPFQIEGYSHFLVSAILGYEFGIGVRSGCFCAHPYILHLLGLSSEQAEVVRRRILSGNRSDMPGMVRISFGLYNTKEDVITLVDALQHISEGHYQGNYIQNTLTGEYTPLNWNPDFSQYFSFDY
jgi:selenocysteine lyase/cysteine desulfurase